jgi:hypothetical protein
MRDHLPDTVIFVSSDEGVAIFESHDYPGWWTMRIRKFYTGVRKFHRFAKIQVRHQKASRFNESHMRNELGGKPGDLVPAIPYGIGPVSGLVSWK